MSRNRFPTYIRCRERLHFFLAHKRLHTLSFLLLQFKMAKITSILLLLATTALEVAGQTGGGWYVVNESLTCTQTCGILQQCNIVSIPDDNTLNSFCKQITDDCADGTLSDGQRTMTFGAPAGLIGTSNFGTGSANGNHGCPNYSDCQNSFKYLVANMRNPSAAGHPDADCYTASITINGYYNHLKTGNIIVTLGTIRTKPPRRLA